jgi:hypothetical protein
MHRVQKHVGDSHKYEENNNMFMFFGGILIAIDLFTFQTASAPSVHFTYIPTTPSDR